MPKYYATDQGDDEIKYEVFGDTPVNREDKIYPHKENEYPYGYIYARHNRGYFIPNFDSGNDSNSFDTVDTDKMTGLSGDYLRHIESQETLHNRNTGVRRIMEGISDLEDAAVFGGLSKNKIKKKTKAIKKKLQQHPAFNPETLFTEVEPPNTEIMEMYSDPGMANSMPTLATIAYTRGGKAPIKPDSDLSPFSSRLAKKLPSLGIPTVPNELNPNSDITNSVTKRRMTMLESDMNNEGYGREGLIPQEEVNQARQELRGILRGGKTRNRTPITGTTLSDQMLPGMERYMQ